MGGRPDEERAGVGLTNLDQPLFADAGATKRDLVEHLDGVRDRILPELRGRPLSVIRVHRDQAPFMQKNVPSYAPDFVQTVDVWAETSRRTVRYALCDDRRTLLWFANQRAVEFHPTLVRAADPTHPTHLVLDLDPPEGDGFAAAVAGALLVREVLDAAGLPNVVKTSGAKGVHVFVPVTGWTTDDAAAVTRAVAARAEALDPSVATTAFLKEDRGGKVFVDATRVGPATVVAAYSPRARPGCPVSFPLPWNALGRVHPTDFTIANVRDRLGEAGPWIDDVDAAPAPPADLLEQGRAIPSPRVEAMHEGRRRARATRSTSAPSRPPQHETHPDPPDR